MLKKKKTIYFFTVLLCVHIKCDSPYNYENEYKPDYIQDPEYNLDNYDGEVEYYDAYDVERPDAEVKVDEDYLKFIANDSREFDDIEMTLTEDESDSAEEEGESIEVVEDYEETVEDSDDENSTDVQVVMEIYDDDAFEEYEMSRYEYPLRNASTTTAPGSTTEKPNYGNDTNYNQMKPYENFPYVSFAPFIKCEYLPSVYVRCQLLRFSEEEDFILDDDDADFQQTAIWKKTDDEEWREYAEENHIIEPEKRYYLRKQYQRKRIINCPKNISGVRYSQIPQTPVDCNALDGVPCFGNRTFKRCVPCVFYTGHYYTHTLIYSVLLGFLGVDRFCLGYRGTAVAKALTCGGFGIWWIYDIILLLTNQLLPADGSRWNIYR